MKVLKFGGSSLADAKCMQNVLQIINGHKNEKIVIVLSACQNITNNLENAANAAKNKNVQVAQSIAKNIKQKHIEILEIIDKKPVFENALSEISNLCLQLENLLEGIFLLNELTPQVMDKIYSFGELLSSKVFYYLALASDFSINWFDVRQLIITDSNFGEASPLMEKISPGGDLLTQELQNYDFVVTQGFIGADLLERTTTLGRGGSDFSAALIGSAILAESIEIWTDVDGILSADPRIVTAGTRTIPQMCYSEIKDLSFCGAKVLHPKSVLPAIECGTPVKILNSLNPTAAGTTILPEDRNFNYLQANFSDINQLELHSIVAQKNCTLLEIEIAKSPNFSFYFFEILKKIQENFDLQIIYSSFSNQKLVLLAAGDFNFQKENFSQLLEIDTSSVRLVKCLSMICISGQNFVNSPVKLADVLSKIFICFGKTRCEILQFGHLFSEFSLIFLVKTESPDEIVKNLHKEIFEISN